MTRYGSGSRLTRICTSWLTLGLVVVSLVGVGAGMTWRFKKQAADQAAGAGLGATGLIAATTVWPALSPTGLDSKRVDAAAAPLVDSGGVTAITVWLPDGTVVYHRGTDGPLVPGTPSFRNAATGAPAIDFFQAGDEANTPLLQGLLPIAAKQGAPVSLVVGVTMPSEVIVDLTGWATMQLLGAIVLVGILAVVSLFALQRRLRQRSYQASHDALTGLGNRFLLESAAGRLLRQGPASVLIMDLDGFKRVNDNLGHATGDELLRHVASALSEAVRPGDVLARLGGDEFAVLLPNVTEQTARATATRLLGVVQRQFVVRGVTIEVDASIGVASAPPDAKTIGELLSAADVAMYQAKRDRLGVCTYSETAPEGNGDDLQLLVELRRAIPAGELELHYQPAIAMRPGAGEFVEALVRWHHPTRGLVAPASFIPLAEETALIHPLTEWVIDEAVRQCAQWRLDGLAVQVAVNVSPRSLAHEGLVETVVATLAKHQLPAAALHIEVTESAIIARPHMARAVLSRLQGLGISISIDDFGAGYTSLAHLKRMPVEVLKIDRTFIKDLLTDRPDQAIVSSVIELGHRLGMTVVAEGVEDQSTLNQLTELGCDIAQGFHISRPTSAAETTDWLRAHGVTNELDRQVG